MAAEAAVAHLDRLAIPSGDGNMGLAAGRQRLLWDSQE